MLDGPIRESSPQPTFTTLPPTPPPSVLTDDEKQRLSSASSDASTASFSPPWQGSSSSASYRPSSSSSALHFHSQSIAVPRFAYATASPHSPPSYLLHPQRSHSKADSTDSNSSSSFVPSLLPSPTDCGGVGTAAWSSSALVRLISEPITKNELQLRAAEAVTAALVASRKSPSPNPPQRSTSPFPLTSHSPTPSIFIAPSPLSTASSSSFHHCNASLGSPSFPLPLLPSSPSISSPPLHQPKPRVARTPLDGLEDDAVTFLSFLASSPQPGEEAMGEEGEGELSQPGDDEEGQRREEKRRAVSESPQPFSSPPSDRCSPLLSAGDAKRISEDAHRLHLAATAAVIVDRPRPVPARIAIPVQQLPQHLSAATAISRYAVAVRPVTAPSAGVTGAMHGGGGGVAALGGGDGGESGGGMSPMSVGSLNSSFSSPMSSPLSFGHLLVSSPPPPASLSSASFSSAASVASTSSTASIASHTTSLHPTGLLPSSRVVHPPAASASIGSSSSSSSSSHRFACSECPKSFPSNSALSMHLLVHSGSKPFPCPSCPRRFRQKGHLQSHVRKHTGEKPYECGVCGKGFKDKSGLNTHGKRVHGMGPTPSTNTKRRGREQGSSAARTLAQDGQAIHHPHAHAVAPLYAAGEGMNPMLDGELQLSDGEGRGGSAGLDGMGAGGGGAGVVMLIDSGVGEVKTGLDSLFLVPPLPDARTS